MVKFILKRIGTMIIAMFMIILITFTLMHSIPGGPFTNTKGVPEEVTQAMEAKYGLDQPMPVQFVKYLGSLLHGDFGPSYKYTGKTVNDFIATGAPVSAKLGLVTLVFVLLVMEEAEINDLFENPLHPYTMGLLASIPGLTKDKSERLQSIPGSPPDMTKPPKGCPFASRCQFARNICAAECPPFVQVGSRQARCWLLQPDAPAEGNPLHEKLAEAERKAH